jgi:thymidine phosphorylase
LDTTAGKDLTERAYAKAMEILENHQAAALPDGAPETINSLLDEFEARSKIDTRVQIAQC